MNATTIQLMALSIVMVGSCFAGHALRGDVQDEQLGRRGPERGIGATRIDRERSLQELGRRLEEIPSIQELVTRLRELSEQITTLECCKRNGDPCGSDLPRVIFQEECAEKLIDLILQTIDVDRSGIKVVGAG